ncbi:putative Lamin A/C globular tail domain protein [Vibrio nigripulchritudo SFn27]|uniref:Putative Lamin A/C globular tail domain protein n=1 Tax=Vibrio nigripulchritudo TaxID=28173 RepID=U4KER2_9VIBR|nr:lamin tail domain-containing protein [Vibrio nigripulchritudo]CCN80544.1 putative Lamin A/C globular tail domain protein [Vibrio nigripulchritudo BLFn1]CCN91189.1 putative Lamin A/C globular tail domain protein [Vibrio nigripulchritudo SFn27]CCN97496.1 putative Lamin A/C globular tail domain protein [Vibrio nigripulchritudo ENn2]CCO40254.1 putative Lamin A/C globular tail domain protein [Vibrio nigripulchritudo SFn135]CCO53180.1 putative Lamin A/C globular tail domain protein [Vibrio nigrip
MALTIQYIQEQLKTLLEIRLATALTKQQLDELWEDLNRIQETSQVDIGELDFKGQTDHLDEYIDIVNRGGLAIDLTSWKILAGSPDQEFEFPEGSVLAPYGKIRVATSGDSEFSFQSDKPIWNNHGDTATLLNPHGQSVSTLAYGGDAYPDVLITNIYFDGEEKHTEGDEYVEISNVSDNTVDIGAWRVESVRNQTTFTFPEGIRLQAQSSVKVFTNKEHLSEGEFSFCSPRAIWNNEQGHCKLFDYLDHEVGSYQY